MVPFNLDKIIAVRVLCGIKRVLLAKSFYHQFDIGFAFTYLYQYSRSKLYRIQRTACTDAAGALQSCQSYGFDVLLDFLASPHHMRCSVQQYQTT